MTVIKTEPGLSDDEDPGPSGSNDSVKDEEASDDEDFKAEVESNWGDSIEKSGTLSKNDLAIFKRSSSESMTASWQSLDSLIGADREIKQPVSMSLMVLTLGDNIKSRGRFYLKYNHNQTDSHFEALP